MPDSFGARLRQRREELGVSLGAIARQTKIKESLLEGLERDDLSNWPSKIYRRSFVRAYAHAIELDPETVVQQFLERHPDPPEDDVIVAMAMTLDRANPNGRSGSGIRSVVGSAFGSLRRRTAPMDSLLLTNAPLNGNHSAPPPSAQARPTGASLQLESSNEIELVAGSVLDPLTDTFGVADDCDMPVSTAPEPEPRPAAAPTPDLPTVAGLCTQLARATDASEVEALLQEVAHLLDARGLIVWLWDSGAEGLRPTLVYGYSDELVSHLPTVTPDADNLTAAAFRSGEACSVCGNGHTNGALAVPLLTPAGCVGVLAVELQRWREQSPPVRAVATIFAALLAQLAEPASSVDAQPVTAAINGTPYR